MILTLRDYFMGRDVSHRSELTDDILANAAETVEKANKLLEWYQSVTKDQESRFVTSGWRPAAVNAETPGAAMRSKHMTGQAVDISDPEGDLDEWALEHLELLENFGLFLEHPSATKGWIHLQIVPPKSGKRAFFP